MLFLRCVLCFIFFNWFKYDFDTKLDSTGIRTNTVHFIFIFDIFGSSTTLKKNTMVPKFETAGV